MRIRKQEVEMNLILAGLVVALALYLIYSLLYPEKF